VVVVGVGWWGRWGGGVGRGGGGWWVGGGGWRWLWVVVGGVGGRGGRVKVCEGEWWLVSGDVYGMVWCMGEWCRM